MITINGKKMGKSYNNVIRLTELFSGDHPLLSQAYSPMTIRFFILQTHYRSTLDFGNEALQAAERGLKRLWEAHQHLKNIEYPDTDSQSADNNLDNKIRKLLSELDEFMNDDFNTAKVLANLFEIVPVINSIKDGHINLSSISSETFNLVKKYFTDFIENILGLQDDNASEHSKLQGVLDLLIEIRKDARNKKDYATSDKIRNQLQQIGILMKDEKDGKMSYSFE
jgi:cysteinyl-tRNA synthetase